MTQVEDHESVVRDAESRVPGRRRRVDAVWVGTGSDTDFAGRDVRGKAVFMFSMPLPGSMNNTATLEGGPTRAEAAGAAAVFETIALPGNMRNVLYPVHVSIPVFALGMDDGYAIRDLIGRAGGRPPRVHTRLDVRQVPNEKSALVWGTLPGATDEVWRRLATDLKPAKLSEAERQISLEELPSAFDALLKDQARGRCVVRVS